MGRRNEPANEQSLAQRLANVEETLKLMQPEALEKAQRALMVNLGNLRAQADIMALKLTVLAEVSRAARHIAPGKALRVQQTLIEALDNDDEWWKAKANLMIRQWIELIERGGVH